MFMNDRIIIICSSFLLFLGLVGHYEKKSVKQMKLNSTLHQHIKDLSLGCYKKKMKIVKLEKKLNNVKAACLDMATKCHTAIRKAAHIINTKRNCMYDAQHLRRDEL
tara:strand:+ start:2589 stop:2909 length:321 start_codon:yes stop_codon:yes gene_type:complete